LQTDFTMVVGTLLRHVPRELGHLNFLFEVLLKASKHNLPLAGFESIADAWDRPGAVSD